MVDSCDDEGKDDDDDDETGYDTPGSEVSFNLFFFPCLAPRVVLSVTSTNLISISHLYPQQNKPALAHCAHRGLDSLHYRNFKEIISKIDVFFFFLIYIWNSYLSRKKKAMLQGRTLI